MASSAHLKAVQKYQRTDKGRLVKRKIMRKRREAVAAARGQPIRYLTEAEMQALRDERSADPQMQQALRLFKSGKYYAYACQVRPARSLDPMT